VHNVERRPRQSEAERGQLANRQGSMGDPAVVTRAAVGVVIPAPLRAVTLLAMSTHRNRRYVSVEAFAAHVEGW
jgi:hypothetical protein